MNICYTGNVGSGKSINAMRAMMEWWASGGVVITNMRPMWWPYSDIEGRRTYEGCFAVLRDVYQWDFQEGQYIFLNQEQLKNVNFHLPRGGSRELLVVVDEASEVWDAGKRFDASEEVLSLFRHSRKMRLSFLLITQDFSWLHDRIRTLCHWVYVHNAIQDLRVPGLGWRLVPEGVCGSVVATYQRGGGKLNHTKDNWRLHDKRLYGTYRTDEMFSDVGVLGAIKCDFKGAGKVERKKAGQAVVWAMVVLTFITVVGLGLLGLRTMSTRQDKIIKLLESRTAIDFGPVSNSVVRLAGEVAALRQSKSWNESEVPGMSFVHFDAMRRLKQGFEVFIEGEWYRPGKVTRRGMVLKVGLDSVKLIGPAGEVRWLVSSDVKPEIAVPAAGVLPPGRETNGPVSLASVVAGAGKGLR